MAKRKSSRGDGSIHKRKDGRWEGRYVIGRNEKGLSKTKNVLAKTKRECEEKLKGGMTCKREEQGPELEVLQRATKARQYSSCLVGVLSD